jgi:cytochrome c553
MKVLLPIFIALFVIGCSQDANKEATETKAMDAGKIVAAEEKSATEQATEKIVEAKDIMVDRAKEVKEELQAKASDKVEETTADLKAKATDLKASATEVVESVKEKVAEATQSDIDADLLYNKCSGCHGGMGEYAALGKSAVIKNWSVKQIEHALKGYRDGTYGRTMKTMMQTQVKNLSDEEIHALAKYISDK